MRKPLINNQIRAFQVRLVDETGKQRGIMPLEEALQMAKERNLDLIQVTEKVEPPVCKIGDLGKYLYHLQKREKRIKRGGEIKMVRLSFNISPHDLEIKAKLTEKFLKKNNLVKIGLILRGRERAYQDFGKEKVNNFLEILAKLIPIKIEQPLKKEPGGFNMIISKK